MLKRSRAMSNVHKADVVITNPTHFAVAISYEHGVSLAPQVVAKGAGESAKQIRDIAGSHQIPVVQNPPRARALYREVDFDEYVPERWFPQVAKILIWVYAMRQARTRTTEE
jgi:flagellar biosynthetic protein FlhB